MDAPWLGSDDIADEYTFYMGGVSAGSRVAFVRFGHDSRDKPRRSLVLPLRLALGAPRLGSDDIADEYTFYMGGVSAGSRVAFVRFGHDFRKKPRSALVFLLRLALGAPRLGRWLIEYGQNAAAIILGCSPREQFSISFLNLG
ncbi:hypothetical protein BBI08_09005 [Planococcus halocryophilus]|uniref:Uncharacterized protein n=1 Tax=Planococcus halocryophilus TaxID=1215089 RepID=A0A1C7DQS1_9BACL|nr:hypothetical protein BBI08_09005 [Planococcus halocryophilus]